MKNVALIFPNKFTGGISNLAMHILNYNLNKYKYISCNMYFIENYTEIKNKDAIIITLQYENDYFNVVKIVNQLKKTNPNAIFIGGGPCAMGNPLPLKNYFDVFVVGEIEGTNLMYELIMNNKNNNTKNNNVNDINNMSMNKGVYYTSYPSEYFDKVKRIYPKQFNIEDYPLKQYTHNNGAYGKAFLLELGRGCPRRCKFCMAKNIYYPPRFRKLEQLQYIVKEGLKQSNVNKVALISPSVGDYKYITDLCYYINEINNNIQISPSSLRADTITEELIEILNLKTLTIAPEAGSETLRNYIKKDITNDHIENCLNLAKQHRIDKIKLYFMVGLPTETEEDINELITLCQNVKKDFRKVEVSINPFVPKPKTPFENEQFNIYSKNTIAYIEKVLKKHNIKVSYENFNSMIIQCILCRGDYDLGEVIETYNKPIQFLKYIKKKGYLENYLGKLD